MEVHEIVDYAALEIVFDCVDDHLLTDIDHLDVRQVLFVFIDCFVDFFVIPDSVTEILRCSFRILTLVIRTCSLDF